VPNVRLIIVVTSAVGLVVGGLWVRDYLVRKSAFEQRTACVGTLTRLSLTKLVYAQEHGLTNGAVIPDEVVWRENGKVEQCQSGGRYSINVVGVDPSCSYTGVVRWSGRSWRHVWGE
jgi:hypothetical protein